MDTTLRTASTTLSVNTTVNPGGGIGLAKAVPAPVRTEPAPDTAPDARAPVRPALQAPARRTHANFDTRLQSDVASAQQAREYLDRVAAQLESVKAALSAKIAGMKSGARDLEARARQLGATTANASSARPSPPAARKPAARSTPSSTSATVSPRSSVSASRASTLPPCSRPRRCRSPFRSAAPAARSWRPRSNRT